MEEKCYESYPLRMVILSSSLSISIYLIGAYILYGLGIIFAVLYLLFCLGIEVQLLRKGCTSCYYYGKTCAFGKGRLSSYFFKKGDPSFFPNKEVSWYAVLPDFLVFLFPLAGGIILLFYEFNWSILLLIIIVFILSLGGNAFIRSLTCKQCKQRELGCPAAELFGKND
ncbi:hypothetical protein [Methanobacterium sp.]|uniref:hypothetical protein n=1 Tax=Methanobacterium sp. TaxID=2164 RepID=UPI002ABBDD05|nr:hypothetical protein [Methanobacterium sp.]MDY9923922.1 hypothetical protein [Methanobacterium sp.]